MCSFHDFVDRGDALAEADGDLERDAASFPSDAPVRPRNRVRKTHYREFHRSALARAAAANPPVFDEPDRVQTPTRSNPSLGDSLVKGVVELECHRCSGQGYRRVLLSRSQTTQPPCPKCYGSGTLYFAMIDDGPVEIVDAGDVEDGRRAGLTQAEKRRHQA
jgi:hypothetical protein